MEFEADAVTALAVGIEFHAAAARQSEIKLSAAPVGTQRAAVVGNGFVKADDTRVRRQKRLNSALPQEINLKTDGR